MRAIAFPALAVLGLATLSASSFTSGSDSPVLADSLKGMSRPIFQVADSLKGMSRPIFQVADSLKGMSRPIFQASDAGSLV